jgi:hypothetical protein
MHSVTPKTRLLWQRSMLTVPASLWDKNTRLRASLVRSPVSNVRFLLLIETALKWFDGQGSVSEYDGGRDLDSLVN